MGGAGVPPGHPDSRPRAAQAAFRRGRRPSPDTASSEKALCGERAHWVFLTFKITSG